MRFCAVLVSQKYLSLLLFFSFSIFGQFALLGEDRPVKPAWMKAAEAIRVQDGFRIRAVATEPVINDPVSARLDYRGRLWVIEMTDYPKKPAQQDASKGTLKVLQDINQDGVYETWTLFAGGLDFPTGVQPFRDGAIVTLAGKIVFLEDRDRDLVSDEVTVLFDGFAEENQQLRANHPTLGPNGLIFVANGLRGGLVQARDSRFKKSANPIDLRNGDFFFDPDGGEWGIVTGKSQFGLTIDDYGRRIGCSNRNPAMHAAFDTDLLRQDPLLTPRDLVVDVALAGEESAVYPRGRAWTTSNLHSGQFSAACGVFAPGWTSLEREYLFVCEPTAYLIQRQFLARSGSQWNSRHVGGQYDFVTSDNEWFRPVALSYGQNNSILIVDMARAVIEHPDFMPPELKGRPDQRDGSSLGRIWQVVEGNEWPSAVEEISLENASRWLTSSSVWQRNSATQFLLEAGRQASIVCEKVIADPTANPRGRARSAFILEKFGKLTHQQIQGLIDSEHSRLRVLGLQLIRLQKKWPHPIFRLQEESDSEVLLEYAATLIANVDFDSEMRVHALAEIANSAHADELVHKMIGTAALPETGSLFKELTKSETSATELLWHLVERHANKRPLQSAQMLVDYLKNKPDLTSFGTRSLELLLAWNRGILRGRHSPKKILSELAKTDQQIFLDACRVAADIIMTDEVNPQLQADGMRFLISIDWLTIESLKRLATDEKSPAIRSVALTRLIQVNDDWVKVYLSERWLELPPKLRQNILQVGINRVDDALWILSEIEAERLPRNAIDPKTSQRLRQDRNSMVAELAQKLLAPDADRQQVISNYQRELIGRGDPINGRKLFTTHCSACHRIDGVGTNVGPDISDTRTKTAEYLLVSILDPNAAIDASYVQTQILMTDGIRCDGLLVTENSDSIEIQQPGGERRVILKSEIDQMQTPGRSLMPEGFESAIQPKEMRDLIAFLKNWRYLKVNIPGVSQLDRD